MREPEFPFAEMRQDMVEEQLRGRDITDPAVLKVFAELPRELFIGPVDWDEAYEDHPLGIDCDQTISQPYIVAKMTQMLALQPGMTVLEIGTGSGYQAAVLAQLGAEVFSIERHPALSKKAKRALEKCGLAERVHLHVGDGSCGWPVPMTFDRILLTCCAPEIPEALTAQLADGGMLLTPVQKGTDQVLRILRRTGKDLSSEDALPVVFVPLVGKYGYPQRG